MKEVSFLMRDVDDLIPYARNARTHTPEQVAKIASSIKEFGFLNPVIISKDGGILAGHGRVLAAKKLGLEKVPCVQEEHLSEIQKKAYILADNRLALDAGWDDEMLKLELEDLKDNDFDLNMLGFGVNEISYYLGDITDNNPLYIDFDELKKKQESEPKEKNDEPNMVKCPECGHEFVV